MTLHFWLKLLGGVLGALGLPNSKYIISPIKHTNNDNRITIGSLLLPATASPTQGTFDVVNGTYSWSN
jgi:hypothetical protein